MESVDLRSRSLSDDHNYPAYYLCATVPCSSTLAFVGNDYCELGDVGTSKGPFTTGILNRSLVGWCWLQYWWWILCQVRMLWFLRTLTTSVNDDFEVHIYKTTDTSSEDVAIRRLEIYVPSYIEVQIGSDYHSII